MKKYKVLQYFQWGRLKLEKGQHILIREREGENSIVSIEHYPDKSQPVGVGAKESMILLKKIEEY
jgi:hypothetical protein